VAIPHTISDEIEKSFISVYILEKSILWKSEQVQIVILMGMAKNDQSQWKDILEKLYRNIIDIDVVIKAITHVINNSRFIFAPATLDYLSTHGN
ncbi:MAG: PTS sugar transporter subunit IIA, partial [Clostridium sp.]